VAGSITTAAAGAMDGPESALGLTIVIMGA
jgi:hypothetical protein